MDRDFKVILWHFLQDLKPGEIIEIEEEFGSKKDEVIEQVKEWIDLSLSEEYIYFQCIEFNSNFTKIRRTYGLQEADWRSLDRFTGQSDPSIPDIKK